MKRLVKETLNDGTIRYIIETNRIFGFIPCNWYTDTINIPDDNGNIMSFDAIFDNEYDAMLFLDVPVTICKREILLEK